MSAHTWQTRAFGQSTDLNMTSTLKLPEYAHKVGVNTAFVSEDGSVTVESRGGKIAGGHDGLAYHYVKLDPDRETFRLSARVTAVNYGRLGTQDLPQQCGFGIMARDSLGAARRDPFDPSFQELPAASNMVFVGVLAGRREENAPEVVCRRGVANIHDLVGVELREHDVPGAKTLVTGGESVRMELGRDERGFYARVETAGGGMSEKVYPAGGGVNLLQQLEGDAMYVGFFASRNAEARFEDIELEVTPFTPPAELPELWRPESHNVRPKLFLRSGTYSSSEKYLLTFHGNKSGLVYVSRDGRSLGTAELLDRRPSNMELKLHPGENRLRCDYDFPSGSLTEHFTVIYEPSPYPCGVIYAAPGGSPDAPGTREEPTSLSAAVRRLAQGGTVYLLEGEYTETLLLGAEESGALDAVKTLMPEKGARVLFKNAALQLGANFWHIVGLEFTGKRSVVSGSFNTVERCQFHHCDETGFQLGGGMPDGFQFAWPCYNTVRDCESYGNRDRQNMNADGFAPKLGVGPGNVFEGCVSHGNVDDGFDLYNKVEKGPNAPVTLRNCVAYENGVWVDPEDPAHVIYGGGGGNGFKLGGEGMPVGHVVENCVSFKNSMAGFSDNFNPGALRVTGCTAIDNQQQNFIFRDNPVSAPRGVYRGNISIRTAPSDWHDAVTGDADETNRFI